jgi:RNA polymerase sigma factor (TIGR02999 family)
MLAGDKIRRMGAGPYAELTQMLRAWADGDTGALERLTPIVVVELRRIAHRHVDRERGEHTLQATALVNELWLRLIDTNNVRWEDRAHFFGICARIMRRILIEAARERLAQKRGGGAFRVTLDPELPVTTREAEFLAVEEALQALGAVDERKARVVELRFFGGLSVKETAHVLGISEQSVHRDWRLARSWLLRELSRKQPSST